MVLHVHKELTDEIELKEIANDFIRKMPTEISIWKVLACTIQLASF